MATTAATFYYTTGVYDGIQPSGGDIRAVRTTLPTQDQTTLCSFPTAAVNIVCDPYTTRSITGETDADKFGWAWNVGAANDGLESVAGARRKILAGDWTLQGTLVGTVTSNYRVRHRLYRVAGDGSRSQLAITDTGQITPTGAGASWSLTVNPGLIIVEAGETLLHSFTLLKVSATALAETVTFVVGDSGVTNDGLVTVPAPGVRTRYTEPDIEAVVELDGEGFICVDFGDPLLSGGGGGTVSVPTHTNLIGLQLRGPRRRPPKTKAGSSTLRLAVAVRGSGRILAAEELTLQLHVTHRERSTDCRTRRLSLTITSRQGGPIRTSQATAREWTSHRYRLRKEHHLTVDDADELAALLTALEKP
jgi:hypothetical protein